MKNVYMRGIILAGGLGTRLHPVTKVISKQILPIYDKPMIYYPLSVLMQCGIRDILIISSDKDLKFYRELLGNGSCLGICLKYAKQDYPRGIADALLIGEEFIAEDRVCLILGDNIFYGDNLPYCLEQLIKSFEGASIFAYYVNNPEEYGVVTLDTTGKPIALDEKPQNPASNYIVPGLYVYNKDAVEVAKNILPSQRGELEINSVNEFYMLKNKLNVQILSDDIVWIDAGTHDRLLSASNNIAKVQKEKGFYIACPEEIAFKKGYITKQILIESIKSMENSEYGKYLMKIISAV